jgi:hypothetical protein
VNDEENDQKVFSAPGSPIWWSISGDAIMDGLRRAHAGEDPDLLYAEYYANSEIVNVEEEDDNG